MADETNEKTLEQGYALIQTTQEKEIEVYNSLVDDKRVTEAHTVWGDSQYIIKAEAKNFNEFIEDLKAIRGVVNVENIGTILDKPRNKALENLVSGKITDDATLEKQLKDSGFDDTYAGIYSIPDGVIIRRLLQEKKIPYICMYSGKDQLTLYVKKKDGEIFTKLSIALDEPERWKGSRDVVE